MNGKSERQFLGYKRLTQGLTVMNSYMYMLKSLDEYDYMYFEPWLRKENKFNL